MAHGTWHMTHGTWHMQVTGLRLGPHFSNSHPGYDATNMSRLVAEVVEDDVELLMEFARAWRRLTVRQLHLPTR